jgi:hypothetical protein
MKKIVGFMGLAFLVNACLKLKLKTAEGTPMPASLNALEDPAPQNDDRLLLA